MGLQISTRESDDVTILDLTGRVMAGPDSDLLSPDLQELVVKGASKLLLNLMAVTQLDSWSINAIAKTYASLTRQGGSLRILCPSSRIQAVLKLVHCPLLSRSQTNARSTPPSSPSTIRPSMSTIVTPPTCRVDRDHM